MGNLRFWIGTAAALTLGTAGCEGVASGAASARNSAQIRTVTGTLRGVHGKVAVAAKTEDGHLFKATINPKTHAFSIALPKGKAAALTVKDDGVAKKVLFVKNRKHGADDAAPAASEPSDPQGLDGMIPGTDFASDADLGDVDFEDGDTIICGDEDGEDSVYEYVDEDSDGTDDYNDDDDDGDGKSDDDASGHHGKSGAMAWSDADGEWNEDAWFDDSDSCDLDAADATLCDPNASDDPAGDDKGGPDASDDGATDDSGTDDSGSPSASDDSPSSETESELPKAESESHGGSDA